jgi:hypothetical protein
MDTERSEILSRPPGAPRALAVGAAANWQGSPIARAKAAKALRLAGNAVTANTGSLSTPPKRGGKT